MQTHLLAKKQQTFLTLKIGDPTESILKRKEKIIWLFFTKWVKRENKNKKAKHESDSRHLVLWWQMSQKRQDSYTLLMFKMSGEIQPQVQ